MEEIILDNADRPNVLTWLKSREPFPGVVKEEDVTTEK